MADATLHFADVETLRRFREAVDDLLTKALATEAEVQPAVEQQY